MKASLAILFSVACIVAAQDDVTTTLSPTDDQSFFLPTCKRTDPDRDECFKNVSLSLKESIRNGMPEFGIPSLDPMTLPSIKLEQATDEITFKAILTDVNIRGLSDFDLVNIQTDFENLTSFSQTRFRYIEISCDFMIMGKYQLLPIEGSGKFFANITNLDVIFENKGILVYKNDEAYLMIHDTQADFEVENNDVEFTDFTSVGMDKALIAEHMMAYHTDEILKDMKPSVQTILSMVFDDVSSKILYKVPFEKLFPQ